MVGVKSIVLLSVATGALGHFIWIREQEGSENEAAITFSESAGKPGPAMMLDMVAKKLSLTLSNATANKSLSLSPLNTSLGQELVAKVDSAPPFSLYAVATFGIFHNSLLKYYASADMVTTPRDWFNVQDWKGSVGLDITIRDPWMLQPELTARSADPGDQCVAHAGPVQDGDACVVAVIRFRGELLRSNITISTFTDDGKLLRASAATLGTLILKVPQNASVFASANYREMVPGMYDGQKYDLVDHWATTYSRILRPSPTLVV